MSDFIGPGQKLRVCTDPDFLAWQEKYNDTDYWQWLHSDDDLNLHAVIHTKSGEIRFYGDEGAIRAAEAGDNPAINEAIYKRSAKYRRKVRRYRKAGRL